MLAQLIKDLDTCRAIRQSRTSHPFLMLSTGELGNKVDANVLIASGTVTCTGSDRPGLG